VNCLIPSAVVNEKPTFRLDIGPVQAQTCLLPHWVPDARVRLTAGGRVLAYTADAHDGGIEVATAGLERNVS
jgi:hypothetical protein